MITDLSDIEKQLEFSINQTISGNSTYEAVISLNDSKFTCAFIRFWIVGNPSGNQWINRKSVYIVATTDINEAYSQANKNYPIGFTHKGIPYSNNNWRYLGFSYAVDTKLSDPDYDYYYGRYIQINSAFIDGSNLKINFENTSSSNKTLKLEGWVKLEKHKFV